MKTEQGEIPALFSCREAWGVGDAPAGLARRLRRGSRACSPMGRSIVSGGDPKVSKGERREASIQWIQPPKAVSDPGVQANNKRDARQCGPRRLFAPRKALWCARRRIPPAPAGSDAPTPARIGTGRPKGRSHFSFGGERKVCKRKPAARRLREKALYCPFLKEGVRNVARSTVGLPT